MIESALEKIYRKRIVLRSCSRTDSGVNAFDHPVSFCAIEKAPDKLIYSLNSILPDDIKFNSLKFIDMDYSLMYNVESKTYVYRMYTIGKPSPFQRDWIWKCYLKFDRNCEMRLAEFCETLVGTHDFRLFTTLEAAKLYDTVIEIDRAEFTFAEGLLEIRITAKRFLHKMIRMLIGLMIKYFKNKIEHQQLIKLLKGVQDQESSFCPVTVPGKGLTLEKVVLKEKHNE